MSDKFVVAIDGPAASGKGALARSLAHHYHLPHLDTGLTYRAIAYMLLMNGNDLENEKKAEEMARDINFKALDAKILSGHEIAEAASRVAVMKTVRAILFEKQRTFSESFSGAILEGRDIGTVVCPDADIKFYIIASLETRAMRRLKDIQASGHAAEFSSVLHDISRRDYRDMTRNSSPLQQAKDAHLLDTTEMSIETAFQKARAIIDTVLVNRKKKD